MSDALPDRVGQVWMAQIGIERFPFVVLELQESTWIVQNLARLDGEELFGSIKHTQFGVEEGIFAEFERTGPPKHPHFFSNILRERVT